jgi:hypothetical protein
MGILQQKIGNTSESIFLGVKLQLIKQLRPPPLKEEKSFSVSANRKSWQMKATAGYAEALHLPFQDQRAAS